MEIGTQTWLFTSSSFRDAYKQILEWFWCEYNLTLLGIDNDFMIQFDSNSQALDSIWFNIDSFGYIRYSKLTCQLIHYYNQGSQNF